MVEHELPDTKSSRWWTQWRLDHKTSRIIFWTVLSVTVITLMAAAYLMGMLSNYSAVHSLTTHLHQQIHAVTTQQAKLKAEQRSLMIHHVVQTITPWAEIGGGTVLGFMAGWFGRRRRVKAPDSTPENTPVTRDTESVPESPSVVSEPPPHSPNPELPPHPWWKTAIGVVIVLSLCGYAGVLLGHVGH